MKKRAIMQKNSIYRKIMLPLLIVLLLETALLIGIPIFGGMTDRLHDNAEDILDQQVENRKNYLETMMLNDWSDLNRLAAIINEETQILLDENEFTLEELQSSSKVCNILLQNISEEIIAELYAKRVNGIYVMFNIRDLEPLRAAREMPNCTGLYICDLDPTSTPATLNRDLLLTRGPISYVNSTNISTSSDWRPMYTFSEEEAVENYDFLYQPFQAAYNAEQVENPSDYGYWSAANSSWLGSRSQAITYSIPLVLEDGTVYGVLGIELFNSYISENLPYTELTLGNDGAYILAQINTGQEDIVLDNVMLMSSEELMKEDVKNINLTLAKLETESYTGKINGEKYYFDAAPIKLSAMNTPFEQQNWVLLGAVKEKALYAAINQAQIISGVALLFMALFGIGGSIFVSRRLSQPIKNLVTEVQNSREENEGIPQLSRTEIAEIDDFAMAITDLSRDLVNASSRIMHIIKMTSVEIAFFEVREHDVVFVTENFFSLFAMDVKNVENLSTQEFAQLFAEIQKNKVYNKRNDESLIYEVKTELGEYRYVRLNINRNKDSITGLAEDVTQSVLERKRIEYERDYDLLTGLINRRAFYRQAGKIFSQSELLGCTAVLMIDLDNLKEINDNYGHELGDQYIYQATKAFKAEVPKNALLSRLSGDEFVLLLTNYESREAIWAEVERFIERTKQNVFVAPSGENMQIGYSGGIAFYPDDSENLDKLIKYADFAMYQIKRTARGKIGAFDMEAYNRENFVLQSRRELLQLLAEGNLQYYFQPIYAAKNGEVFAYEALMRVNMPTLHSPDDVLKLAKKENKLHEIERLSMLKSVEYYQALLAKGEVDAKAYLFVNSIANECLTEAEQEEFAQICGELTSKIVIELTESAEIALEALEVKRNMNCYSGLLALDDYGSGYNSEKNLLEIAPEFIKVDMSIIRDIDSNEDKQLIVQNLVQYAHKREMLVLAEGIETLAELHKVLELGVDLLQGYALARPNAVPAPIAESAKEMIVNF